NPLPTYRPGWLGSSSIPFGSARSVRHRWSIAMPTTSDLRLDDPVTMANHCLAALAVLPEAEREAENRELVRNHSILDGWDRVTRLPNGKLIPEDQKRYDEEKKDREDKYLAALHLRDDLRQRISCLTERLTPVAADLGVVEQAIPLLRLAGGWNHYSRSS